MHARVALTAALLTRPTYWVSFWRLAGIGLGLDIGDFVKSEVVCAKRDLALFY
jgi:hypothetical protein